jgi:hypothetical protein
MNAVLVSETYASLYHQLELMAKYPYSLQD